MIPKMPLANMFWLLIFTLSLGTASAQELDLNRESTLMECDPLYPCALDAHFTATTNGCDAQFQGASHPSECNVREIWLVQGANVSLLGNTVNYTFSQSGAYEICHIVEGLDAQYNVVCTETLCLKVEINCGILCNACDIEEPIITMNQTQGCQYDFQGSHGGEICPDQIFEWAILDANYNPIQTATGQNFNNYTFPASGDYWVCLNIYVEDEDGVQICQDRRCEEITVECENCNSCDIEEPIIGITQTEGCSYDFQGSHGGQICPDQIFDWTILDANYNPIQTASGQNFNNYTFPASGEYWVCLSIRVFDENGVQICQDRSCEEVIVECDACDSCDISPEIVEAGNFECTFDFRGLNTGTNCPSQIFEWTVFSGNNPIPIHTQIGPNLSGYTLPTDQPHTICLSIYVPDGNGGNVCAERTCIEVECECPLPAVRDIEHEQSNSNCYTHDFSMSPGPQPGETYGWDLNGDGLFDGAGQSSTFTYPADGIYEVILVIWNECGSTTITELIEIDCCPDPEEREILANQSTNSCGRFSFSTDPGLQPGESYEWDIDGDGVIDGSGASITADYPVNGTYLVTLYVSNECGVVRFTYELEVDCCELPDPRDIEFTQSMSNCYTYDFHPGAPGLPGEIIEWDLNNDGVFGSSTTITFPADGTYEVGMRITNECGEIIITLELEVACDTTTTDCGWPKGYGSSVPLNEKGDGVVVDASGNVFVHGLLHSSAQFEGGASVAGGAFLAKYDNCGLLLWVIDVAAYGIGERSTQLKIDNQGNPVLLSALATSTAEDDIEYKLTKFSNSNGAMMWSNTIEMWKILPSPSFDIDMATNQVYLVASVSRYLRITQANGTVIVNYVSPVGSNSGPKHTSYLIKFDASGNQIWQDHIVSIQGFAYFQDVVVDESSDRVYLAGSAGDHPHPVGDMTFNSNNSITIAPTQTNRLFITSYTGSGSLLYANLHNIYNPLEAFGLEFSNIDQQLYLMTSDDPGTSAINDRLYLFNTLGNLLSSVSSPRQSPRLHYDQVGNYLLTWGSGDCNAIRVQKFTGTSMDWFYEVGGCFDAQGSASSVFADPTSEKIFITGSFWTQDLVFNSTDMLPLAGDRDVFISTIRDQGNTVLYKVSEESENQTLEGVEEMSLVSVYPNPTNDVLNISTTTEMGRLELLNVSGAVVAQENISAENQTVRLDLVHQSAGLYFLRFTTQSGRVEVMKVVKR